ncbi:MAG: PAS domain-containing protein [Prevotellaceae bacterium]|jgi:nitrogen fixation/metabolism regulation signal transduction histidine kinase|nr:PAS domain-containing protein [Prevotellaceae bacterium]
MRIKTYFTFLVLFLIGLGIWLVYLAKGIGMHHLYLTEGVVVLILIFLQLFYRKIVKPLNSIGSGMELLREQDFSSRLGKVGQYEADRIVNVFNRMMDQLKSERLRLREQNNFLDLLIQASPMGVIVTTLSGEVSEVNPMALQILEVSKEDIVGKPLLHIRSPLTAGLAALPKNQAEVVRLNDANVYKCTRSSFIDQGFPHPFYLIERMTEEVMRAEKRAYGKVIRMIAHEVNNTTAGIISTLDTVEDALATDPDMADVCEVMHVCTDRCHSMNRFITRFADVVKIPEPQFAPALLNNLAATCVRFMESLCNEHRIALHLHATPNGRPIRIDTSLMEQVLVNIIKNAVESIEQTTDGRKGEITVSVTSPVTIEVTDNGAGISPEAEAKLFTPFFSTKPNGQGIGLVLIREILIRHECTFSLRTYDDGLTRFRISFKMTP